MSCKFCGKKFNRGFNLRRHEQEYCAQKDPERDMSETRSHVMDSEDDASSTYESGSPITTDDEMETKGGGGRGWRKRSLDANGRRSNAWGLLLKK